MSMIQDAKFRDFVRPGHLLRCRVEIESLDERAARIRGVAECEGREVARARIVFVLLPIEEIIQPGLRDAWIDHIQRWAKASGTGEPS